MNTLRWKVTQLFWNDLKDPSLREFPQEDRSSRVKLKPLTRSETWKSKEKNPPESKRKNGRVRIHESGTKKKTKKII